MSVRFKYYLRGCGLGILVASLVFIVSLHAHGGAMSDEKAMQRASELGMIMPDDTQTQEAETQTTELPVKETNLPDTQRTTQAVTQKVPQNDTQKQTERDTSSEQNDTSKESEKKAEEKKKTQYFRNLAIVHSLFQRKCPHTDISCIIVILHIFL